MFSKIVNDIATMVLYVGSKIVVNGIDLTPENNTEEVTVTVGSKTHVFNGPVSIVITGNTGPVQSTNGDISVSGDVNGNITTTNGDIVCGDVAGAASTTNGDIDCKNTGSSNTVNGDININ